MMTHALIAIQSEILTLLKHIAIPWRLCPSLPFIGMPQEFGISNASMNLELQRHWIKKCVSRCWINMLQNILSFAFRLATFLKTALRNRQKQSFSIVTKQLDQLSNESKKMAGEIEVRMEEWQWIPCGFGVDRSVEALIFSTMFCFVIVSWHWNTSDFGNFTGIWHDLTSYGAYFKFCIKLLGLVVLALRLLHHSENECKAIQVIICDWIASKKTHETHTQTDMYICIYIYI